MINDRPKISIIIPTFNEEKTILKTVNEVLKLPFKKEIIIVDDGSSDNTPQKIKKISRPEVLTHFHIKNQGKGAAIKTGLKKVTGSIIVIQDADMEYNPKELIYLIDPIIKGEVEVVYGSRFLTTKHPFSIYYLGNRIVTYMTQILFLKRITDMETCYKVFKSSILKKMKLKSNRFDIEPEITAKILKKKFKFKELPISYKGRTRKEGKKLTWKDGLHASIALIRYRLSD